MWKRKNTQDLALQFGGTREGGCAYGRLDDKNGPGEIKLIEGFYVRLLCSAFIPGRLLLRVGCLFCRVF